MSRALVAFVLCKLESAGVLNIIFISFIPMDHAMAMSKASLSWPICARGSRVSFPRGADVSATSNVSLRIASHDEFYCLAEEGMHAPLGEQANKL